MRNTLKFGTLLALPMLFGCPSTESLCRTGVDQVCERVHASDCRPMAEAGFGGATQFQAVFGTDEQNCKELLYANPLRPQTLQGGPAGIACEEVKNDQQLCTNLGQSNAKDFNLGKAQACSDAREELSCQDYLAQLKDPTKAPASCAERCE